jgi:hypothetical protein
MWPGESPRQINRSVEHHKDSNVLQFSQESGVNVEYTVCCTCT